MFLPALELLEVAGSRRLVVSAQVRGDPLVANPIHARQDRLAVRNASRFLK